MFARDLRKKEDRHRSPLEASWLVQADEVFLPVCSFGDRNKAITVLFLDELQLDDPERTALPAFWAPWLDRSLAVAQILVGQGDLAVGLRERAAIWQISNGTLYPGVLVTPAARMRPGKYFQDVGAAVQSTLREILEVEQGLAAVIRVVSEHEHRMARTPHRHRLPPRHAGMAVKPRKK